ncbi:TPA: DUF3942 family protein [Bacillus cereus]|nr:DUF3942 family protein [Bacillus cereus]HDR3347925.1 DUF3942 family protein [Bacillus cereus]
MSKLSETISKLKDYVGEDQEEKLLSEKFNQLDSIFININKEFSTTGKKSSLVGWSHEGKFVRIEDRKLEFSFDKKRNVIEVNKVVNSLTTKLLDEIGLKDEELYCTKREEKFTEDIFSEYLNEVFGELIN